MKFDENETSLKWHFRNGPILSVGHHERRGGKPSRS